MFTTFARQSAAGLRLLLVMSVVLGVGYPLVVTVVGQTAFSHQANGSLLSRDGDVVGSSLIGQTFEGPQWFLPRPSAAGDGYDPASSGASNLGPESPDLLTSVEERRTEVAEREGMDPRVVPSDALTASGSGLDPHISPEYARVQVDRVAAERGLAAEEVQRLVDGATQGRTLGFLGQERVNVLELNLAVEELGDGAAADASALRD